MRFKKDLVNMIVENINDKVIDNKYTEFKDKFKSLSYFNINNLDNINEKYSIDSIEDETELDTTDHNNDKYFEWA